MISFIQYLLEDRAKVIQQDSAYNLLKEYKDDPTIYISFTEIDKIGINPQSDYNTPLGIYTYPLKEIWHRFDHGNKLVDVPFAGQNKYIWILKQTGNEFINDLYRDYTSADYYKDIKKLISLYKDKFEPKTDRDIVTRWRNIYNSAKTLVNGLRDTHGFSTVSVPVKNLTDEYKSYVKVLEIKDEQLNLNAVQTIANKYQKLLSKEKEKNTIEEIIDYAVENAKAKNAATVFWNVTRVLSSNLDKKIISNKTGNGGALEWNKMLRKLGYVGFADRTRMGIIHPAEPLQAVFLTKSAFKTLRKIQNVRLIVLNTTKEVIQIMRHFYIRLNNGKLQFIPDDEEWRVGKKFEENLKWLNNKAIMDIFSTGSIDLKYRVTSHKYDGLFDVIEPRLKTIPFDINFSSTILYTLYSQKFNKKLIPYFDYLKKYAIKFTTRGFYPSVAEKYDKKQKNYPIIKKLLKDGVKAKISRRALLRLQFNRAVWNKLVKDLDNDKIILNSKTYYKFNAYVEKYAHGYS